MKQLIREGDIRRMVKRVLNEELSNGKIPIVYDAGYGYVDSKSRLLTLSLTKDYDGIETFGIPFEIMVRNTEDLIVFEGYHSGPYGLLPKQNMIYDFGGEKFIKFDKLIIGFLSESGDKIYDYGKYTILKSPEHNEKEEKWSDLFNDTIRFDKFKIIQNSDGTIKDVEIILSWSISDYNESNRYYFNYNKIIGPCNHERFKSIIVACDHFGF